MPSSRRIESNLSGEPEGERTVTRREFLKYLFLFLLGLGLGGVSGCQSDKGNRNEADEETGVGGGTGETGLPRTSNENSRTNNPESVKKKVDGAQLLVNLRQKYEMFGIEAEGSYTLKSIQKELSKGKNGLPENLKDNRELAKLIDLTLAAQKEVDKTGKAYSLTFSAGGLNSLIKELRKYREYPLVVWSFILTALDVEKTARYKEEKKEVDGKPVELYACNIYALDLARLYWAVMYNNGDDFAPDGVGNFTSSNGAAMSLSESWFTRECGDNFNYEDCLKKHGLSAISSNDIDRIMATYWGPNYGWQKAENLEKVIKAVKEGKMVIGVTRQDFLKKEFEGQDQHAVIGHAFVLFGLGGDDGVVLRTQATKPRFVVQFYPPVPNQPPGFEELLNLEEFNFWIMPAGFKGD